MNERAVYTVKQVFCQIKHISLTSSNRALS